MIVKFKNSLFKNRSKFQKPEKGRWPGHKERTHFNFTAPLLMKLARLLAIMLVSSEVLARPEYQARVPNGDNVAYEGLPWPGVGHYRDSGGGPNNQFGLDFISAGYQWTTELCQKDSDGDGKTNGEELGDPNCVWTPGSTPSRVTDITPPGLASGLHPERTINSCANYTAPPASFSFNLTFPAYNITSATTSYVRYGFNFTKLVPPSAAGDDMHAVRFEPIIKNTRRVHHMLLYGCTASQMNSGGYLNGPTTAGASKSFAAERGGKTKN